MPFCVPRKIKTMRRDGKALFNRYETLDDTLDFLLQARRRQYTKKKAIRNYRIVTKKTPLFEIAYSSDVSQLRAREWNYVRVDLPQIMPSYLEVGTKARRTWLVAHFTQVAVAVDGATELPADDYDSGEDGGSFSEEDDESLAVDARAVARAFHADQTQASKAAAGSGGKMPMLSSGLSATSSDGDGDASRTVSSMAVTAVSNESTVQAAAGVGDPAAAVASPRAGDDLDAVKQRHMLAREMSSTLRRTSVEQVETVAQHQVTQVIRPEPPRPGIHLVGSTAWYTAIGIANILCILSRIVAWDLFVGLLVLVNTVGVMKLLTERESESSRQRAAPQSARAPYSPAPARFPSPAAGGNTAAARPAKTSDDSSADASHRDETASVSTFAPFGLISEDEKTATSDMDESVDRPGVPLFCSVDPTSFHVRIGPDYKRNKKKAASLPSFYDVVRFETYKTPQKVEHIDRFLNRDRDNSTWFHGLPPTFIVNVMIPGYPPNNPIWGKTLEDGNGFSWVFVLELNAQTKADLASGRINPALRLLQRYMASEEGDPLRDRFKGIPRLFNVDEVNLGGTGRRLVQSYNAKPLLTRPQHTMYKGDDFAELDVDVHKFAYIARQGVDSFRSQVRKMILDLGFVIEGHSDDELPEQLLGCVRVNYVDFEGAPHLPTSVVAPSSS